MDAWDRSPKPDTFARLFRWVVSRICTLPVARSMTTPRSPVPRRFVPAQPVRTPRASRRRAEILARIGEPLLQTLNDPSRFGFGDEIFPWRHGRAGPTIKNSANQRSRGFVFQCFGCERGAKPAMQLHAVAGAAVLAHQVNKLALAFRIERGRIGESGATDHANHHSRSHQSSHVDRKSTRLN